CARETGAGTADAAFSFDYW
nr:immunoglobulin heavy chain junction region [Macaca mulatta]